MPKEEKILPLSSATWFLSVCGVCWGLGQLSRSPPPRALPSASMGSRGALVGGWIQRDVSQGNREWECVPQQAENQVGTSTQRNTQMQTGTAESCWGAEQAAATGVSQFGAGSHRRACTWTVLGFSWWKQYYLEP